MFTGIIEELGEVSAIAVTDSGARITVSAPLVTSDASEGDSISVNGVCLTALDIGDGRFSADVSGETLRRSTLGGLAEGSKVNLERAVTPSTRLGGHFVQGHVDGTGTFLGADAEGDFWTVTVGFPEELSRYFVYKGSVAVEGISLTIAKLDEESFDIAVIPKTWELTNLSSLKKGDPVNLEADVIAKYVERLVGQK
ncbi:MAG: riboflavin synthase [Acidobacteriota bacterium]|nr:MAG: riboflavin synthase [Acidobacteriota bacterium]